MLLRKFSQTLKVSLALMLAVFSTGVLPTSAAYAHQNDGIPHEHSSPDPTGNNGTIKIHEAGTPSDTESNDPKVCSFNIEGFGFDEGQTGYIMFDVQGGDGPTGTPAGPYTFGPADANGFYATQYFSLTAGHYKATLYDNDDNEKAKSKVFKVSCVAEAPTATATVVPCVPNSGMTDKVSVRVFNTDDGTNVAVTYMITLGGQTKTVTVPDGEDRNVEFGGLAAGTYSATVTGSDGTVTIESIVVAECPFIPATPTVQATIVPCTPNSGMTDKVSVRVFNTDDGTNTTVTYTITLGGQTKTVTVPDGEDRNVEFGGLASGNYSATVTGSDGTVTSNSVTVTECPFVAEAPTATATVVQCVPNSGMTDKVSVRVFNTDDGTNVAVTYMITLGGQTKTVTVPDGEDRNVEFGGLAAGTYSATVTGSDGTVITNSVEVAECERRIANIDAAIICVSNGVKITLTNSGNASGVATVYENTHTVTAGESKEVILGYDLGTPFQTVVTVTIDGVTTTQTVSCTPGSGGDTPTVPTSPTPGQVLGTNTGGQGAGQVLSTSTELPETLPATGDEANPFLILVASLMAYAAAYFLQGRRQIGKNTTISA